MAISRHQVGEINRKGLASPPKIDFSDALGEQQSLNPVGVCRPLFYKTLTLPMRAAQIFLIPARDFNQRTNMAFAAPLRDHRAQDCFDIDTVGFDPACAAINLHTCGIDHETIDPVAPQQPRQPEAVKAGLITQNDLRRFPCAAFKLLPSLVQFGQQCRTVAAL
jgi:hypothetical protein